MWQKMRLWLGFGLLGVVILLTLQNIAIVELNFFFWSFRLPRAILVFVIFLSGFLVGWIVRGLRRAG